MTSIGEGAWGGAIASVLSRPIGMGDARHRVGGAGGPVDDAFPPAYRRSALLAAGGFDERFLANEDFELDGRLRAGGGIVWLEPARSTWRVREPPGALARQMFRYGSYKARTLLVHPETLRLRQLAPPGLIVWWATTAVRDRRLAGVLGGLYVLAAGGAGSHRGPHRRYVPVARRSGGADRALVLGGRCGLILHRAARADS